MARPKKPENEVKQQLNIRVKPAIKKIIERESREQGVPVSVLVESLITEWATNLALEFFSKDKT